MQTRTQQQAERARKMGELAKEARDVYERKKERVPNVVKDSGAKLIVDRTERSLIHALEMVDLFRKSERFSVTYFLALQKMKTLLCQASHELEEGLEANFGTNDE